VNVDGAVAVITGGASGLGKATAATLHDRGAHVVLLDLPTAAGTEAANQIGDCAHFAPADVTCADDVAKAIDFAASLGDLRIVVNCAGIATPGKVLGKTGPLPLADFERVVRINLIGTFNVIRLAAATMAVIEPVDGERGVIIDTASVAAFDGQIGQPAYAASKGGVAAMTLPIARELARHLIRVVTIAPGIFETPMMAGLPADAKKSSAPKSRTRRGWAKPPSTPPWPTTSSTTPCSTAKPSVSTEPSAWPHVDDNRRPTPKAHNREHPPPRQYRRHAYLRRRDAMSTTPHAVIVGGARTPVGKFMGALKDFSGADLGGIAIAAALAETSIDPGGVDYVIMGQALTAGAARTPPARQHSPPVSPQQCPP